MNSERKVESHRRLSSRSFFLAAFLAVLAVALGCLVSTAAHVAHQGTIDETRPAGAIVVFGAAEYAGRPSPVFRARLDHAYELFNRNIAPLVIITGGSGRDPQYSEGSVGRDYLASRGIPDGYLIAETQGEDTAEQAVRTAGILKTNRIRDAVAVSDAYHLYRIKQLMKAQGVTAYGAPRSGSVPRGLWGRILAALRESASYYLWKLELT